MEVYKAQIAQLVEQRIENPCVPGSIPGLGTIINKALATAGAFCFSCKHSASDLLFENIHDFKSPEYRKCMRRI